MTGALLSGGRTWEANFLFLFNFYPLPLSVQAALYGNWPDLFLALPCKEELFCSPFCLPSDRRVYPRGPTGRIGMELD